MTTCPIPLHDKTNTGWGFEQDFKGWDKEIILQWIGVLDEEQKFLDEYEDTFKHQNINGLEHFRMDRLGNSKWCQNQLGIDEKTANIFSSIVRHRICQFDNINDERKSESIDPQQNNLQIARIDERKIDEWEIIECKCGECSLQKGDTIYVCKNKQCLSDYFCQDCGPYYHRKKTRKNHIFDVQSNDIVLVKDLIAAPFDSDSFDSAEKDIIALIGIEKYNQIKPWLEKAASLAVSNFPMVFTLICELSQYFEAASNAVAVSIDAANEAKEVLNFFRLYEEIQIICDRMGWEGVCVHTKQFKAEVQKALAIANAKSEQAAMVLANPLPITDIVKAGMYGTGIITAIEMGVHAFRYFKGDISGNEWLRLSFKAVVRNSCSLGGTAVGGYAGGWAGCKIGAQIGTAINPGLGTAVGAGVGIITGLMLGYFAGKGAEWAYEYVFPSNEQIGKRKLMKEALTYFHLQEKDLDNKDIFNEKALKKLFRKYALEVHPDRRGGDHSEWYRLSTNYGILITFLRQNESNKKIVKKAMDKSMGQIAQ